MTKNTTRKRRSRTKKKQDLLSLCLIVFCSLFLPLYLFSFFILPSRLGTAITILLLFVPPLAFLLWRKRIQKEKVRERMLIFVILLVFASFVRLLFTMFSFSFQSSLLPFFLVAGILGLAGGVAILAKWLWKSSSRWGRVGYFAVCFFLIAMFTFVNLSALNYALDFSKPQSNVGTVVDKYYRHRSGRKGRGSCHLRVSVEGKEISIEVPATEYQGTDIGDTYLLVLHRGAFGVSFYMPDEYKLLT